MAKMGITIYGCEQDEAVLFREMAPRFGVMPTITAAPVSEANIELAFGKRCISVSHIHVHSQRHTTKQHRLNTLAHNTGTRRHRQKRTGAGSHP